MSRRKRVMIAAGVCAVLTAVFFADFVANVDHYVAGRQTDPKQTLFTGDWDKERTYYATIEHHIFSLGAFPHFQLSQFQGTHALFANPEVSVLSPVNLLLPLFSLTDFFSVHLLSHYLAGLIGVILLCQLLRLPAAAIVLGFVIFAFNGRILVHYWGGHSQFISYTLLPFIFYFYLAALRRRHSLLSCAIGTGVVMALMFHEGGVHIVNWTVLFFALAMVVHAAEAVYDLATPGGSSGVLATARAHLQRPTIYLSISAVIFAALGAIKILPGLAAVSRSMTPGMGDYQPGYASLGRMYETFAHIADAAVTPLAYMVTRGMHGVESYNFIGPEATVLCVLAIAYALFVVDDADVRRVAIVCVVFLTLGLGFAYRNLIHVVPLLRAEGVAGRMTMVPLALAPIIVPVFVDRLVSWRTSSERVRNAVMGVVALVLFVRMFAESRKWMVPAGGVNKEHIPTDLGPEAVDGAYWPMFWLGTTITCATLVVIAVVYALRKRGPVARVLTRLRAL